MPGDEEYRKGYALLAFVTNSDIIVVGRVAHKHYVNRAGITTDIIIRIETLVKGEPNMGDYHVIFMIRGGEGYSPYDGQLVKVEGSSQPEFEVGERVMVFLTKRGDNLYDNYAHDKLHLVRERQGKVEIEDNIVGFGYLNAEKESEYIDFPLALAVNLAEAHCKDPSTRR